MRTPKNLQNTIFRQIIISQLLILKKSSKRALKTLDIIFSDKKGKNIDGHLSFQTQEVLLEKKGIQEIIFHKFLIAHQFNSRDQNENLTKNWTICKILHKYRNICAFFEEFVWKQQHSKAKYRFLVFFKENFYF